MLPSHRICYCSLHPFGGIVHRNTRLRHRKRDAEAEFDEDEVPTDLIQEYLADIENTDSTRASILGEIRRQRGLVGEAQFNLDDPQNDERQDNEIQNDEIQQFQREDLGLDLDNIDQEERLDDIEATQLEADYQGIT